MLFVLTSANMPDGWHLPALREREHVGNDMRPKGLGELKQRYDAALNANMRDAWHLPSLGKIQQRRSLEPVRNAARPKSLAEMKQIYNAGIENVRRKEAEQAERLELERRSQAENADAQAARAEWRQRSQADTAIAQAAQAEWRQRSQARASSRYMYDNAEQAQFFGNTQGGSKRKARNKKIPTLESLRKKARQQKIHGRSTMTKAQLMRAVR